MGNIYQDGTYLSNTGTWHAEDAHWKALQIKEIIQKNMLQPKTIAEIGCGAGEILQELSKYEHFKDAKLEGSDISPQAIEIARKSENKEILYSNRDMLSKEYNDYYEILLVIDVFEHVPDYIDFLKKCRSKADFKIYHIPLDIHVSSILRNTLNNVRYSLGHLHYFTAETALSTLRDTGHEIVDYVYTNPSFGLFWTHPSIKKAIANIPRWLISRINISFAARVLGGYSLLVLTK